MKSNSWLGLKTTETANEFTTIMTKAQPKSKLIRGAIFRVRVECFAKVSACSGPWELSPSSVDALLLMTQFQSQSFEKAPWSLSQGCLPIRSDKRVE